MVVNGLAIWLREVVLYFNVILSSAYQVATHIMVIIQSSFTERFNYSFVIEEPRVLYYMRNILFPDCTCVLKRVFIKKLVNCNVFVWDACQRWVTGSFFLLNGGETCGMSAWKSHRGEFKARAARLQSAERPVIFNYHLCRKLNNNPLNWFFMLFCVHEIISTPQ